MKELTPNIEDDEKKKEKNKGEFNFMETTRNPFLIAKIWMFMTCMNESKISTWARVEKDGTQFNIST